MTVPALEPRSSCGIPMRSVTSMATLAEKMRLIDGTSVTVVASASVMLALNRARLLVSTAFWSPELAESVVAAPAPVRPFKDTARMAVRLVMLPPTSAA